MTVATSFCRLCIASCGIRVQVEGDRVVAVRGDAEHPLSRGYCCSKGRSLGQLHHDPARLDHAVVGRGDAKRRLPVREAVTDLAASLRRTIDAHGPDSVGIYTGTAGYYDASKRTVDRFVRSLGTASKYSTVTLDAAAKPLVYELVTGFPHLRPMIDEDGVGLVLFVGTNPVVSHGQLHAFPDPVTRVRALARRAEVWVVDPRRTETAALAGNHLAARPGTDHVLLAWLVREVLSSGADQEYLAQHAEGVDALRAAVAGFTLDGVVARCDVAAADAMALLDAIRRAGRIAAVSGTGMTMNPAANAAEWLLLALLIVTGSLDRPGGMWCNPGFFSRLDRAPFRAGTGDVEPGPPSRPELNGRNGERPAAALADEIETGNVRSLLVFGGNPVAAMPEPARFIDAVARLDVLATFDVASSDTVELATHVLPCAGQLERADMPYYSNGALPGIFGQYAPAVLPLSGDRRPQWWYAAALAEDLSLPPVLPKGVGLDEADDLTIFSDVLARTGLGEELLASPSGIVAEAPSFGWVHDQVLAGRRWDLAPAALVDQLATLREATGLLLAPRRQPRHVNSVLRDVGGRGDDCATVLMNPADAEARGLHDGDVVTVANANGVVRGPVRLDQAIRPGVLSVPHGFRDPHAGALASADDIDQLSGMVTFAAIAVEVTRAD